MSEVDALAQKLGISKRALDVRRRRLRMEHGENAEVKLEAWLVTTWTQMRDEVRVPAKTDGYVEVDPDRQVPYCEAIMAGRNDDGYEPESVPVEVQDMFSAKANQIWGVVKAEENAKREARARAERLRQAEFELRQQGKSHESYAKTIDDAIEAMKREARAA